MTTIKPKTTNFYLSRNPRYNSGRSLLPPKCFQPKISKSPCICLGNIKCQKKKVSANEPKWRQDPSKHLNWPFQTAFQSTKVIRDPPRGFRPKPSKSPCICLGNEKCPKKSVCKWLKNVAGTFKTSKLTISDNFSINQSHQGPFWPKWKKKKISQIFVIFRVWKSTFQYFLRFFKNYWDFQTLLERIRKWLGNN